MNMKPLTLRQIAVATGGTYCGDLRSEDALITGVVSDNRDVAHGNLFVCIKGERTDGHLYAEAAYRSGASCCLCERRLETNSPYILVPSTLKALKDLAEYYRSLFHIPVIGVTGSVGKTTAKEMTAAVLSKKYTVLKTRKNLNNEIGVPLMLLSLRAEHKAAVIEMGISEFGEMSRLSKMVRPDICLMTAIGYCHLENLGDLSGVLKAKSEVFQYMAPDSVAVVCGDDKLLRTFDPGIRKITYGFEQGNDYTAENVEDNGTDGLSFDIVHGAGRLGCHIPAYGRHLVLAALAATAIGRLLGLTDEEIRRGLRSYEPVGGRSNVRHTDFLTVIDDCYNANPNSMAAALSSLAALPGRKVAILGDMKELGSDSAALHRETGALAGELGIDCLITCGDLAAHIYEGFVACAGAQARHFPSKEQLFSALPSLIQKGDTVLVKASRSMAFETIVDALIQLD